MIKPTHKVSLRKRKNHPQRGTACKAHAEGLHLNTIPRRRDRAVKPLPQKGSMCKAHAGGFDFKELTPMGRQREREICERDRETERKGEYEV